MSRAIPPPPPSKPSWIKRVELYLRSIIVVVVSQGIKFGLCLEAVIRNLPETCQCRMYSRKLLMMGREDARNM